MSPADARLRRFHRLLQLCVGLLLATTVLSAFMRLSLAGLGCGDWPACYGAPLRAAGAAAGADSAALVPASLQTPVQLARAAHRVVASLALVLILSLVLMSATGPAALRRLRGASLALLGGALALALLGIATPGARLPAVAMGNLLGGLAMLALAWRLLDRSGQALRGDARPGAERRLRHAARAALGLLALQLFSGALLSGSYAGLSCTSLVDCQAAAAASGWDLSVLNPWREPAFSPAAPQLNIDGALVQWLHRVSAGGVALALLAVGAMAWRRGHVRTGLVLGLLTVGQLMLGLWLVLGGLPLPAALLHNLGAALLLVVMGRLA